MAFPSTYQKTMIIKKTGYLERTSILDFVGAASSRDRFNSRLVRQKYGG